MTDESWRDGVLVRLTALEVGQKNLADRMGAAEKDSAVAEVHHNNVEKRLGSIEDTLKWLVRLVIGSIIGVAVGFALKGGFVL